MATENQTFCIIEKQAATLKLAVFYYHQECWNANYLPALINDFWPRFFEGVRFATNEQFKTIYKEIDSQGMIF